MLAVGATLGVEPSAFLRADPLERSTLVAVVDEAVRHAADRDNALAKRVIYELSEALKRGGRGG